MSPVRIYICHTVSSGPTTTIFGNIHSSQRAGGNLLEQSSLLLKGTTEAKPVTCYHWRGESLSSSATFGVGEFSMGC